VLIGLFLFRARKKGARALMNLSLFRGKTFAAAATTQFLANGVSLCFQVLVPLYLIEGCHVSPQKAGFLLAPLGVGMMCSYPLVGEFAHRFGIRRVSGRRGPSYGFGPPRRLYTWDVPVFSCIPCWQRCLFEVSVRERLVFPPSPRPILPFRKRTCLWPPLPSISCKD